MQITRLNIERVRNLQTVALSELQPFNIFYGANGSGKTSILEAIHLLATGRSFRTHIPKHYIQYEASDAIVFAQSAHERIGMQKLISGEQLIKVNGDTIALINDNDFGVVPGLYNKAGNEVTTGLNNCLVSNGALVNNGALVCNLGAARVKPGTATERPNRLYTFRFPKKLSEYVLP